MASTVIAVCARKGGANKSTIALSLGCAAKHALLCDADPQQSLVGWYHKRELKLPECVATLHPDQVRMAVRAERQPWYLIDTPPHANLSEFIELSDFVIVPARCSLMDLMAVATTLQQVKAAGKPGAIVLTSVPPGRGAGEAALVRSVKESLRTYQESFGIPVAPMTIGHRQAFVQSLPTGQSALEYQPRGKAAEEVLALWSYISAQAARSH
jgi:chromosome partitioning protein